MSDSLVLVGYFIEIHELAKRLDLKLTSVVDPFYENPTGELIELYSNDKDFLEATNGENVFLTPDSPKVRRKLFSLYSKTNNQLITLICPSAMISPSAVIGDSCCVQSCANISSNAFLGVGVKVNSQANIMHDCFIGNFTTIAPNAVLLGAVVVGECSYIGANATILPGITIGSNVIVGAGSVVTKNIPSGITVCGNPARKLR